jgi:Ca-activated chloride channel homolog
MTIPLLGPVSLTGFSHIWWLLFFVLVVLGLAGLYVVAQIARRRRLQQFANTELLDSVAPHRPSVWRHVPAALLGVSLLFCTIALAGPTYDQRLPRNRAVVMLAIDVSQSMRATDVEPDRLTAAKEASKKFVDELTPGINLGVIAYAGTSTVLVSPTTNRDASRRAIDNLQVADRTATGEAIFTALSSISTVGAVIGGGDTPPPARIVLFSDGKETVPSNPDNPKGAFTAARTAKDQGVPISTISFGTEHGEVEVNGEELNKVYSTLQDQIGYETVRGEATTGWLRLAALVAAIAAVASLLINRRLPL